MSVALDADELRELERKARAATLEALRSLGGEGSRRAIRERALRDGGFTPRELAASPPAGAAEKHANVVEYRLEWALTNLKRDGLAGNPRRSVWCLTDLALEPPARAAETEVTPGRLAELQGMGYRDYLRTPEWRRTRGAALHRAGYRCMFDARHVGELHVHHNSYDRLGAELESDLLVLCAACHRLHHREYGRPGRKPRQQAAPPPASVGPPLSTRLVTEAKARAQPRPSLLRRLMGA